MKVGFNLLLWTAHVTQEHFPLFDKLQKLGYDGAEIPVLEADNAHYEKVGRALKDSGLQATVVGLIPDQEHNPLSPDPADRDRAYDHFRWIIDCSRAAGARVICGPLYQPLGQFTGTGPTEEEKKRGAEVHRKAARYAAEAGITLALEPLNRFEAYFLNTTDDAADYTRRINHPNLGILFDTFHANIEEEDPVACINRNIDHIKHIHVSENNRGVPGRGHVDWPATFKALRSSGYDNWLTVEAFGRELPEFAAATRIWRNFFSSPDEVCSEAVRFIRQQWDNAK